MRRPPTTPAALRLYAVLAGGAAGAVTRAGVAHAIPHHPGEWPWATLLVNVAGSLLLGWVSTRRWAATASGAYWQLLAGTGFCGALTTFSTLQVETIELARNGRLLAAAAYALTSIGAGMAAVGLVTAAVHRRRRA